MHICMYVDSHNDNHVHPFLTITVLINIILNISILIEVIFFTVNLHIRKKL